MPRLRRTLSEREEEYRAELIRFCGCGMLSQAAVMRFFGWSRPTARAWLEDVPAMQTNGSRLYTASDIARKMYAQEGET